MAWLLVAAAAVADASETIVVLGSGAEQRAFDTPYAASVVDAATLRASGPMVSLSEAAARVPGLVVGLRHNHAQDLQISSRGFGARASFGVRGLRLIADGIPASSPDGQGQVSHFDLAGAARIEVLRGPFSALYGASSGGVIALVSSAPRERRYELAADAGSDGLRQGRATLALPLGDGWSLRAGGSAMAIDGFRPHASARRTLANARLERVRDDGRLLLVVNALQQPAEDPLGLTRAQFDADPVQTTPQATQFDTRKNTRQTQAGLTWLRRFDAASVLQRTTLALYAGERAVRQWQAIAPATQAAARHPGGVVDFDRRYEGMDLRASWRLGPLRATTGAAVDRQREDRRGFENFSGTSTAPRLGVTGRLRRDEHNRASARDVYAQAEGDLADSVSASAGLRTTRLRYVSADRFLGNGDDSGALGYRATLPVLGLRWQPLAAWSLYASAGRGFEAPTLAELAYRGDGGSGFNSALRAQRSRQWELGAKWREPALEAGAELALFDARSIDEIGVQSSSGGRSTFQNVGRTRRRGTELSLQTRVAGAWRVAASATWLDARYRDSFLACAGVPCSTPTLPVPAGNRVAGTVPTIGFVELAHRTDAVEWAIEVRGRGRQPVDDRNSDFAAGHGLLALRALWRVPFADGTLELLARIDNLAGRRVAGSVIVNEGSQRFFEPATGRTLLASLRWQQRF